MTFEGVACPPNGGALLQVLGGGALVCPTIMLLGVLFVSRQGVQARLPANVCEARYVTQGCGVTSTGVRVLHISFQ
jgi:hypothetical protein